MKHFQTTRHGTSLSKGQSLLHPLPQPRNCLTLPIPLEFCMCKFDKKQITVEDFGRKLGEAMVEFINEEFYRFNVTELCEKFELDENFEPKIEEIQMGSGRRVYEVIIQVKKKIKNIYTCTESHSQH
jgi:hypothetical protein